MSVLETNSKEKGLTVLLPAGRMPLPVMERAYALAREYGLEVYLSTAQNLRMLGIREEDVETIKSELAALGALFKGTVKFPLPRICIGKKDCKLGLIDTEDLSAKILARFMGRAEVKPKIKIAVSGCPACCSNPVMTDIGIMATRAGYEVFAGGKGGQIPKVGIRIAKGVDEERVLEIIEELVDFHYANTLKKERMNKLLKHPDFPFQEV